MKKATITLGMIIVVAAGLLLFLRFLTPEDTWICSKGQWVKHGNPSVAKPTKQCGTSLNNNININTAGNLNTNINIENSNTNAPVTDNNSNENLNTNVQDANNQPE